MTSREMAKRSAEVRELCKDIGEYLEALAANIGLATSRSVAASGGKSILRSAEGKLIGQFENAQLSDFIRRAPGWLATLTGHVRDLEEQAYEDRVYHRKMRAVTDSLFAAREAGLSTPIGRRHIETALRTVSGDDGEFRNDF